MTLLNQGKDCWRDAVRDLYTHVHAGSGTTAVSEADTALEVDLATKAAGVADAGTGSFTISAVLTTADANGNSLTEVGPAIGTTVANRVVHTAVSKTASIEVEYEFTCTVVNA